MKAARSAASRRGVSRGLGFVVPRWGALRRFWQDRSAPAWKKLLLLLLSVYVFFPVDLVPDVIPVWGWLDDAGAMGVALLLLSRVLAPYTPQRPQTPDGSKPAD